MIRIKRIHSESKIPTRGSSGAGGLDLYTVEAADIAPGQRALLSTGLSIQLPEMTVGLIWPRSKLAAKQGVAVLAGVLDQDYRGIVYISLLNTSGYTVEIRPGDRVAQLIIQEYRSDLIVECEHLSETARGIAGVTDTEMRLR